MFKTDVFELFGDEFAKAQINAKLTTILCLMLQREARDVGIISEEEYKESIRVFYNDYRNMVMSSVSNDDSIFNAQNSIIKKEEQ